VRPVCRDLVDSPPILEAIPTAIVTPRFEPSVRRALGGICCATCHALSGLFCADRAPNTDPPREKRLRACASQQTVAAAAESSRGTKNSRKRSAKEAAVAEEEDGGFTLESRGFVRAAGEAVAVGDDRTCLPDALWICLTACGKQIKLSSVRKSMVRRDENSDPTYAMAKSTALQHGIQLAHISRLKASPAGLFNCELLFDDKTIHPETGMWWEMAKRFEDASDPLRNFKHLLDEFQKWHEGTAIGKELGWPFQRRNRSAGNPKDVVVRNPEKYNFVTGHESVKNGITYTYDD
jgi:hypothetical protein